MSIVWLIDYGVVGVVVSEGAHISLVRYGHEGLDYEVWIENEEFITIQEAE